MKHATNAEACMLLYRPCDGAGQWWSVNTEFDKLKFAYGIESTRGIQRPQILVTEKRQQGNFVRIKTDSGTM